MTHTAKHIITITCIMLFVVASAFGYEDEEFTVGLVAAEELVVTGSTEVALQLPADLDSAFFFINGELIAADNDLAPTFRVDALALGDGEHCLYLEAMSEDGRHAAAEAVIWVENPTAQVVAVEKPESIYPGAEITIIVQTAGDAAEVWADLSSFLPELDSGDLEVEAVDEDRFEIFFRAPDQFESGEGWQPITIGVTAGDGSSHLVPDELIFVASGPTLPIRSHDGLLELASMPEQSDFEATAQVVDFAAEMDLVSDQDAWLELVVEGEDLDQAELLISMHGFGGHLVVPIAGLDLRGEEEQAEGGWEVRALGVPLRMLGFSRFADEMEDGWIVVGVRDKSGVVSVAGSLLGAPKKADPKSVAVFLSWNGNLDLDLWLTEPSGEMIHPNNTTSASGGTYTRRAGCGAAARAENIFWHTPPLGDFTVIIAVNSGCTISRSVPWRLHIVGAGMDKEITGVIESSSAALITADTFTVLPNVLELKGVAKYYFTGRSGMLNLSTLDDVRILVQDSTGNDVATGKIGYAGRYSLTFARPTSTAGTPYRVVVFSGGSQVYVGRIDSYTMHSYEAGQFDPYSAAITTLDFKIPRTDSPGFHIFRVARRARQWYAKQGITLPRLYLHWSEGLNGAKSDCSYYWNKEIYIRGAADNPDPFDDSVINHEIGHLAMDFFSQDDSLGGDHSLWKRSAPEMAWSEGSATYLGQSVLGTPWFINHHKVGKFTKRLDNIDHIPLNTEGGTESGKMSEWVAASFLWDLQDPVDLGHHDSLKSLHARTMWSIKRMKNVSNLGRGVSGHADFADFVRVFGCALSSATRSDMHDLLKDRFSLDWSHITVGCP